MLLLISYPSHVVAPVTISNTADYDDIKRLLSTNTIDNIVISPGPGTPENPLDVGADMCGTRSASWALTSCMCTEQVCARRCSGSWSIRPS